MIRFISKYEQIN